MSKPGLLCLLNGCNCIYREYMYITKLFERLYAMNRRTYHSTCLPVSTLEMMLAWGWRNKEQGSFLENGDLCETRGLGCATPQMISSTFTETLLCSAGTPSMVILKNFACTSAQKQRHTQSQGSMGWMTLVWESYSQSLASWDAVSMGKDYFNQQLISKLLKSNAFSH